MKRMYQHCPECRQRMSIIGREGERPYRWIAYACPCDYVWTLDEYTSTIHRGWRLDKEQAEEKEGAA